MFKYKKFFITIMLLIYIVLTFIELIYYLRIDSNLFGLIYMLLNIFIFFLFVPIVSNYNRYFSKARISKLLIIVFIGLFSSYVLNIIINKNITYIDNSINFINSIYAIKNIIKPIMYLFLLIFTSLELKLDKILVKYINKKKD